MDRNKRHAAEEDLIVTKRQKSSKSSLFSIGDDMIMCILLSASIRDQLAVMMTCKQLHRICSNNNNLSMTTRIRKAVIQRLNDAGYNGKEFLLEIERHECMITGSFIMQCVYDEYWPGSDIDVYGYQTDDDGVPGYRLGDVRWKDQVMSKEKELDYLYGINKGASAFLVYARSIGISFRSNTSEYMSFPMSSHVAMPSHARDKRRSKFVQGKLAAPLNVLSLKRGLCKERLGTECLKVFVDKTFDIEMCKMYYDGKTFKVWNKEAVITKKTTMDYTKVMNMRLEFYGEWSLFERAKGCWEKAEGPHHRGYCDGCLYVGRLMTRVGRSDDRVKKYKTRGFEIVITNDTYTPLIDGVAWCKAYNRGYGWIDSSDCSDCCSDSSSTDESD